MFRECGHQNEAQSSQPASTLITSRVISSCCARLLANVDTCSKIAEWILKHKLYLDLTGKCPPKYRVPQDVPIPEHSARPILPVM